VQPWEQPYGKPNRIVTPLEIMIDGPLGGAAFNNEFGRPNLTGYFRTFELEVNGVNGREVRGYHKPIMIAGGLGNIRDGHVQKNSIRPGDKLIVLGGPALLIGLGGGAASSMASGASAENLDFASVQRDNPEMERRVQEVLDVCWAMGDRTRSSRCMTSARAACRTPCRSWCTNTIWARAGTAQHPESGAGHEPA
jgi:phosphoribosylformylglycinamidine synthase